jgi:hypothetical protein
MLFWVIFKYFDFSIEKAINVYYFIKMKNCNIPKFEFKK